MAEFYTYILQVNVALAVFYLLYRLLFSPDTFFGIRRFFLLTMLFLAFTYPLVPLSGWLEEQVPLQAIILNYADFLTVTAIPERVEPPLLTVENICLALWLSGGTLLLARMLMQLGSVCRLAVRGLRVSRNGLKLIVLQKETAPFSFFGWIFINPDHHPEKELQEIVTHERAHVNQYHSLDVLAGELLSILFWFNPAVWFIRYEIRQNLEFLADKDVVSSGYNRKNYQYHLLRLTYQSAAAQIVNNFNVSQLKKRITMMNKKRTSRLALIKYALLLPVTGGLILASNARAVARVAQEVIESKVAEVEKITMVGKVVDENGKPMRGVSIVIKGTNEGTVTGANGSFSISGHGANVLVFSYVGKASQSIPLRAGLNDFVVTMRAAPTQLEGIEVVGYSEQGKRKEVKEGEEVFVAVEEQPQFPGGKEEMLRFLGENVMYPVEAQVDEAAGRVLVSFVVDKQGKITGAKVARKVHPALDAEALRVINSMPVWQPGKQRGTPVDAEVTVPINFALQGAPTTGNASSGEVQSIIVTGNTPSGAQKSVDDVVSENKNIAVKTTGDVTIPENGKLLYIVDGVKQPSGYNIPDIEEIESISVLKDAAGGAIYGEEGREGVIVITTRKGGGNGLESNSSDKFSIEPEDRNLDPVNRIIIEDGKLITAGEYKIAPEKIKKFEVLKDKKEIERYAKKYGRKSAEAVFIITTVK